MRHALHFAFALALISATTHAQITNPDALVAKPPRNPARQQNKAQINDLQWLWQFASPAPLGNKPALIIDPRFTELLQASLTAPQSMWGSGTPLAEAAKQFLAGPGSVASIDNRHLTITGCITDPDTSQCTERGLLWLDLGSREPLLIFAALRWTEQSKSPNEPRAPFNLWLFSSRSIDPLHLSDALKLSLVNWIGSGCSAPSIQSTLVVDPSGIPHILGALDAGITPAFCTSTGHTS